MQTSSETGNALKKTTEYDAVIAVISACHVRFLAFEAKFGRPPGLHDPLFFDDNSSIPVQVKPEVAQRQLVDAARIAGVDAKLAISVLESPKAVTSIKTRRRTGKSATSDKLHRRHASPKHPSLGRGREAYR